MTVPVTPPTYPSDELADRIRDFFLSEFAANISFNDAAWLGSLISKFLQTENITVQDDYQRASRRFIEILSQLDRAMSRARDPAREWAAISLALGLESACQHKLTGAELGRDHGVSRMAISYQTKKVLQLLKMEPAFTTGRFPSFRNLT